RNSPVSGAPNAPANPPVSQPVEQPVNQLGSQPLIQPVNQSVTQPASQQTNVRANPSTSCATAAPASDWVCVDGRWLSPDDPLVVIDEIGETESASASVTSQTGDFTPAPPPVNPPLIIDAAH